MYRWITRSATQEDFLRTKSVVTRHWSQQGYTRSRIREAVKRVYRLTRQSKNEWKTGFIPCHCMICTYTLSNIEKWPATSKRQISYREMTAVPALNTIHCAVGVPLGRDESEGRIDHAFCLNMKTQKYFSILYKDKPKLGDKLVASVTPTSLR